MTGPETTRATGGSHFTVGHRRAAAVGALLVIGAIVGLCDPAPAVAAPKPTKCTFSTSGLAFGVYDPTDPAPLDSTATLTWDCPGGSGAGVLIEISPGLSGDGTSRALAWGAERLRYDLFLDAPRTRVWGDGRTRGALGPLAPASVNGAWVGTVFGRVFAGQNVAAGGPYDDVVQVTFLF